METVLREHVQRQFGPSVLPREQLDLLPALIVGLPAARLGDFLTLFERLYHRFAGGSDTTTEDFARTLARQFDALTIRVSPASRSTTWRICGHVLRHHPRAARYLSFTRTVALLVAGKGGRDRAAAWARRHMPGVID
jgi:hypothetical protein